MSLPRNVQAEWLDSLPANDPRAIHSRRDLRRVNRIMGTLPALRTALDRLLPALPDGAQLIEFGCGDGSLMARLAAQRAARWPALQVSLLDLQPVVSTATQKQIAQHGWQPQVLRTDVLDWLRTAPRRPGEVIVANLFVHHFDGAQLDALLSGIAARATAFVCCEPLRSRLAFAGSHLLGLIGCNDVTRHDAVASVRAGFRARELSAAWPDAASWNLKESSFGPLLHRLVASRVTDR